MQLLENLWYWKSIFPLWKILLLQVGAAGCQSTTPAPSATQVLTADPILSNPGWQLYVALSFSTGLPETVKSPSLILAGEEHGISVEKGIS